MITPRIGMILTFVSFLILFSVLSKSASAEYCKWDLELFSMKEFSYSDLDLSNLQYTSNLRDAFQDFPCNNTINDPQLNSFMTLASQVNMTIYSLRPLNESTECYFIANSSSGVTIRFYGGFIEMSSPIDGCYPNVPGFGGQYDNEYKLSQFAERSWNNYLFVLHLDINDSEARTEIPAIKQVLQNSAYNNIYNLDVGVPELFATNHYYPYAITSYTNFGITSPEPLVMASRDSPISGSYSSVWNYPLMFFRIGAINSKIIVKLQDVDQSLDYNLNNLAEFKNNASEIFQDSKSKNDFQKGIVNLESLRDDVTNYNSQNLNSSEIQQINILTFLEGQELNNPDANQHAFSQYFFAPAISKQLSVMQQNMQDIQNKGNKIETQKDQLISSINQYINDLSILQQINAANSQTNWVVIGIYVAIVALIASIFVSLLANWNDVTQNWARLLNYFRLQNDDVSMPNLNRNEIKKELERALDIIGDVFIGYGIAVTTGSVISLNINQPNYWNFLLQGMIFLFFGVYTKTLEPDPEKFIRSQNKIKLLSIVSIGLGLGFLIISAYLLFYIKEYYGSVIMFGIAITLAFFEYIMFNKR